MSLVTAVDLLTPRPNGWAVGAFNVHNMEDVQGVIQAAEELDAPVILQVSESAIKHAGVEYAAAICRLAARKARVPVAIQLDHGRSFDVVARCIRYGFSSVMIDGSKLPFAENVALTRRVVEMAHACGVSVEGELGLVGGKEDDLVVEDADAVLTDPEQAVQFVEQTGVDVLAPAIGTAHGIYKGEPKLDYARLKTIREKVDVPLVLHGSSGLSGEALKKAIAAGAHKINIGTDLKCAVTDAFKDLAAGQPDEYEPRVYFGRAREAVAKVVAEKIRVFGAAGKASAH